MKRKQHFDYTDPLALHAIKMAFSSADSLIKHIRELNHALDIPNCIKEYDGGIIDEKEFILKLPKVAELAIGDACTGSNPREITPEVMEKLLYCCYYDTEVAF